MNERQLEGVSEFECLINEAQVERNVANGRRVASVSGSFVNEC